MFQLIAGPCVIESEKLVFETARLLKSLCTELNIGLIFKASFDKANRTELKSYRGPGLQEGLAILKSVKQEFHIPVTSDIHETWQAELAAEVLDVIQIPAFLCRQTDLLLAAARTKKIINIKKGQFIAPQHVVHAVEKIRSTGNEQVWVTERGTSFGYDDCVVDFRSFDILRELNCPLVFDASHSAKSRRHIETLATAAISIGVDYLFLEVHPHPEQALSDGKTSVALKDVGTLLHKLMCMLISNNEQKLVNSDSSVFY